MSRCVLTYYSFYRDKIVLRGEKSRSKKKELRKPLLGGSTIATISSPLYCFNAAEIVFSALPHIKFEFSISQDRRMHFIKLIC